MTLRDPVKAWFFRFSVEALTPWKETALLKDPKVMPIEMDGRRDIKILELLRARKVESDIQKLDSIAVP